MQDTASLPPPVEAPPASDPGGPPLQGDPSATNPAEPADPRGLDSVPPIELPSPPPLTQDETAPVPPAAEMPPASEAPMPAPAPDPAPAASEEPPAMPPAPEVSAEEPPPLPPPSLDPASQAEPARESAAGAGAPSEPPPVVEAPPAVEPSPAMALPENSAPQAGSARDSTAAEEPSSLPPAAEVPPDVVPLEEPPAMPPPLELPPERPASATEPATEAGPEGNAPAPLSEPGHTSLPPLEPAESAAEGAQTLASVADFKRDPELTQTAGDSTMIRSEMAPRNAQSAGKVAAQVGDEVITLNELRMAVNERLKGIDPSQPPSEQEVAMVAFSVLQELVERSIVVQEAKRELKKPKQLEMLMADADKTWRAEELPPLLRKYAVSNEYELKEKLKQNGLSLEDVREAYRRHTLSQGYMRVKIGPKMTVSLPEMREYYEAHFREFDRPAQIVWREVVIDVDKCRSRTEARAKVDAILGRLLRNEDFVKVAATESHGPNKAKGGLWETSPGGYGVEEVNAALERLPIGRVSQVIEAPTSYHIVRVEKRRAAGPASFAEAEVQGKIRNSIFNEKVRRETAAFIDKLRKQTLVTTMFDKPEKDSETVRAGLKP